MEIPCILACATGRLRLVSVVQKEQAPLRVRVERWAIASRVNISDDCFWLQVHFLLVQITKNLDMSYIDMCILLCSIAE